MGTPLRLLLTPKHRLSVSPLRKVKSCDNEKFGSKNLIRNRCVSARKLDFSSFTYKTKEDDAKTNFSQKRLPEIRINDLETTQRPKNSLLISTPEKAKLLKCGLPNKNTCHVIGTGGFGTVVEAKYKGRNVAVKVTKRESLYNIPELYMLGLEHENIIKTVDVIFQNNYSHCMIIMEYIENTVALKSILEDKAIEIKFTTVLKYATDVCKGLLFLHKNNVIHLDIKPANILVCPGGLCKLCDFGSCMKIDIYTNLKYRHKGTVIYTAPEILLGRTPTSKSDVYSVGILMWQLLVRETPFSDIDSSEVLIYKVVKYKLRPYIVASKKDAYTQLFCKCWEADPLMRPEISDVLVAFKHIAGSVK